MIQLDYKLKRGTLVSVQHKITEGKRERVVSFKGHVVKMKGAGDNAMLTVRQTIDKIDVEKIFPLSSPFVVAIDILAEAKSQARRARKELAKK